MMIEIARRHIALGDSAVMATANSRTGLPSRRFDAAPESQPR